MYHSRENFILYFNKLTFKLEDENFIEGYEDLDESESNELENEDEEI